MKRVFSWRARFSIPKSSQPLTTGRRFRFTRLDFALLFAMSIWGSNFVVSKVATDVLPPMGYNALRFTAAAIAMTFIVRLRGVNLYVPRREYWPIILNTIIGYVLYQPAFINGIHETSASNSVLIITAGPVWVVLFNALRRQERITRGAMLGVGLAVSGVLLVIIGRYAGHFDLGGKTIQGDILMLIASILWAGSLLTSRRPLTKNDHLVATYWLLICGTITQIICGVPFLIGFDWTALPPTAFLAVFYSGVISIVGGGIVFNYAVNKLGTARTSVYTYMQPVVAAALAIVVLGEPFTPLLILGGLLVLAGVALARRA